MPEFLYIGLKKNGSKVESKITAQTETEAITKLRLLGIRVVAIGIGRIKKTGKGDIDVGALINKLLHPKSPTGTGKMAVEDLMIFTKQMATLIDAGISIVGALDMLASQASNPNIQTIIDHVRQQVEAGKDFATSLEKHPEAFDTTYVSLVRAGAQSGQLDVMMKKLTVYIEKSNKLRKQLKSALSYPTVVLIIAFALSGAMIMFVVPMFAKNYQDAGKELPGLTQGMIDFSNWLQSNIHVVIGGAIATFIAFTRWKATATGHRQWDNLLLRLPIFGNLILKIAIARFTGTMATLVSSGIGLPEALKICAQASGNVVIEKDIANIEGGVVKGKSLSEMMGKSPYFPSMVAGMVGIGESTGRLDSMLEKIALVYEEDVESALAAALKMVEPAMFVVVGGIVGFILLAMYLPIFDMASTVG
jgi:type IV pilus assembly protein PilC